MKKTRLLTNFDNDSFKQSYFQNPLRYFIKKEGDQFCFTPLIQYLNIKVYEPHHENCLRGFRAVQPQKMARSLNFGLREKRNCTIYVGKTKARISCAPSHKQKSGSHDAALFVFSMFRMLWRPSVCDPRRGCVVRMST